MDEGRATTEPGQIKHRIAPVDYIKAIAIVAVVFTHAGIPFLGPSHPPLERILRQSWVGFHVPAFFVVAGFLYYKPYSVRLSEVGRRLLRILVPYLVVSSALLLLGYTKFENPSNIPYILATGSALGIYYFIFLLSIFIPCTWLFSRLKAPVLWGLLTLLLLYTVVLADHFTDRPISEMFWRMRNPFPGFALGYFLAGWVIARHLQQLQPPFERAARFLWVPLLVGVVIYVGTQVQAMLGYDSPIYPNMLYTVPYTACVVGLIIIFTRGHRVPSTILFLSEASLTIYLYHVVFQSTLFPYTYPWSPLLRVPAMVLAGLLGSSFIALAGRKLFGPRSRILLGA